MTIKNQWLKIKENWLIILLVLILLFSFSNVNTVLNTGLQYLGVQQYGDYGVYSKEGQIAGIGAPSYERISPIYPEPGFAPEVKDRLIVKSAYLTSEVNRGKFFDAEKQLKDIIKSSNSFVLNQNVQKYCRDNYYYYGYQPSQESCSDRNSYYSGSYQLRIEVSKYNPVLDQLRQIGKMTQFSENEQDVTASYVDAETQLAQEKQRLERYLQLYKETTSISDKILLEERIDNQERMIKYLEDSLKTTGQLVQYSTISITLNEKQSQYQDIIFVKIVDLIKSLVNSINALLKLAFILLPWIIIFWIIKRFRHKKGNF